MASVIDQLSKERKELQEKGLIPEWFTTQGWQLFKEKYLWDAEGVTDTYRRIADVAATKAKGFPPEFLNNDSWADLFFQEMNSGRLAPSTPVLANTGTDKGCSVSCSGGYIEDSVSGFYEGRLETAVLTKNGFGTSAYLGDIRPRGSNISSGGKTSGTLPVFQMFVDDMRKITQGVSRRGAWAGYLPIDHDDFWEVAQYLEHHPDDLNIGWNFSDEFLERLNSGDEDALKRWKRVLKVRAVTGKGYLFFVDKVNRSNPEMYKDLGLDVKASNLCVTPETLVLTDKGHIPIADLEGESVNVWNGEEFSEVTVFKTGTNQDVIKVDTKDGYDIECTPYHKFYIFNGYGKPEMEVRAMDLKPGDKLVKFNTPIIEGFKDLNDAYINGFYSGDGCLTRSGQVIYLYGDKRKLKHLFGDKVWKIEEDRDRETTTFRTLKDKFFVPNSDYTIDARLEWLAGWLDADGCVYRNGLNEAITGSSINKDFLKEIQLMLQTLGVNAKITKMRDEGYHYLPDNKGEGGVKKYHTQDIFRLLITSWDTQKLLEMGLTTHRLTIEKRQVQRDAQRFVVVSSVEDNGRKSDTYCFTEPKRNKGVFNGILTGQCTEITLHSSSDHTFTCVLSSMNASRFDEWEENNSVFIATVFLDCIVQVFIDEAKGIKHLENAVKFTEKGRALGLGVLGFHTYLQDKMIPIEGLEAHMINVDIFRHLHDESLKASQWMAKEWGEPEWCRGYGVRNTHRTAVAPNTSSALLCGGVSQGIEPVVANVYKQGSAAGNLWRINPSLLKIMKDRGVYNDETIERIGMNNGSILEETWLNDEEKQVFKTAYEIDQGALLRLANTRQPYICQAQSLNLFFDADEEEEYISQIHKEACLSENIKSLYYMRSSAGVQASKGECVACEG